MPAELAGRPLGAAAEAMEAAVTPTPACCCSATRTTRSAACGAADEVAAVVDFCRRHDLVLVSDEIHCDLILDAAGARAGGAAPCRRRRGPRIVTLMSPSKTFNLPGLNFAFAVIADAELRGASRRRARAAAVPRLLRRSTAAEAAYREGGEWLAQLLDYLRGNRDLVERRRRGAAGRAHVARRGHVPGLARRARTRACDDPAARACVDAGLALSPGADFGDPGFLRLNFGCPASTLQEALRRLRRALG